MDTSCDICPVDAASASTASSAARAPRTFIGTTAPSPDSGYVAGDFYCDTSTFECYSYSDDSLWVKVVKTSPVDLSAYATEAYVDTAVTNASSSIASAVASSSTLSSLVESKVSSAVAREGLVTTSSLASSLGSYATTSALSSAVSGLATETWANSTFVSKTDSGYSTLLSSLNDLVHTSDLSSYATKTYVLGLGYLTSSSAADTYVTKTALEQDYKKATGTITSTDSSTVPTSEAVYDLVNQSMTKAYSYSDANLATAKSYADSKVSGLATTEEVDSAVSAVVSSSVTSDTTKSPSCAAVQSYVGNNISGAVLSYLAANPSVAASAVLPIVQSIDSRTSTVPSCAAVNSALSAVSGASVVAAEAVGSPEFLGSSTFYYKAKANVVNSIVLPASVTVDYVRLMPPAATPSRFYVVVTRPSSPDSYYSNGDTFVLMSPYGYDYRTLMSEPFALRSSNTVMTTFPVPTASFPIVLEFVEYPVPEGSNRSFVVIPRYVDPGSKSSTQHAPYFQVS